MAEALGCEHHTTTPYHPQANGMIERTHRRIKEALRARLHGRADWPRHLPWVLLGLRAAVVADTDVSPAEMVYGRPLTLPGVMMPRDFTEPSETFLRDLRGQLPGEPCPVTNHNLERSYLPDALSRATHIYIQTPPYRMHSSLSNRYEGPFKIISRTDKVIKYHGRDGMECTTSIDRVKPAPLSRCQSEHQALEDANLPDELPIERQPLPGPSWANTVWAKFKNLFV